MAHTRTDSPARSQEWLRWAVIGAGLAIAAAAFYFQSQWLPATQQWLARRRPTTGDNEKEAAAAAGNAAHGNPNAIDLSPQARKNIGLTDEFIQPVKLEPF